MTDQLQVAAVLQRPQALDGFGAQITVHAPRDKVAKVAAACVRDGLGAVYVTPFGCKADSRYTSATNVVRAHQAAAGSVHAVLLDAQRYSGKARVQGTEPHDLRWTEQQHRLGLPWALTDSGYIGEDDDLALRTTLEEGSRHRGDTIVALPLHHTWLSRRADHLRHWIGAFGRPVALMVEHRDDPFGAKGTVQGLLEVLQTPAPVGLLRCDVSAVGALAHGAVVAAVGTSTGLRHIFPITTGGGGPNQGAPAAVVPRALVYKQLNRIREAVQVLDDQTLWECRCSHCGGRPLDWLFTPDDAFQHSLATLTALTQYVLSSPDPAGTWRQRCFDAQFVLSDIESNGLSWRIPRFLGHWLHP
ncbi:MAG TPA: hypothetical protein VFP89_15065 [Propionibacteriaceae bacterium]|nr:hypothetical protein [Propionibacteriaceae bacterium]